MGSDIYDGNYFLSLSDMILIEGFAKAFGENNQEFIKKKLFDNGMDVSHQIEEVVCKHRNLQGIVVDCLRWEGMERTDKEWIKSGAASWNAVLETCSPAMRVELNTMSKTANFTGDIIDHIKKHKNVKD